MISAVQHITKQNEYEYSFDVELSYNFEEMLYTHISNDIQSHYNSGVEIYKTPKGRDGGVDIIIRSCKSITIMGQKCPIMGKNEITIYVECKTTEKNSLSLEKFAKNILLVTEKMNVDYFILATNSTVSPHTFYHAQKACSKSGIKFKLVDKNFLYLYLKEHKFFADTKIQPINTMNISYQSERKYINGNIGLDLYLFFANYNSKPSKCTIKMKTDRNWSLSEETIEIYLQPSTSECKKISIEKKGFDGIEDIFLELIVDGNHKTVHILGTSLEYNFVLPFTGKEHKKIHNDIVKSFFANNDLKSLCLIGEAGIGKTRIIDETLNDLISKGVECKKIWIESQDSIIAIYRKIEELFQLSLSQHITSLSSLILSSTQNMFKRYFLVFEDIHNAPKEFFDEFKESLYTTPSSPVFIVLSGRNDHSVYNDSFYSFLEWIDNNHEYLPIHTQNVKEITNEECIKLIKMVINEAPNFVVEIIKNASKGNPFYLIQYIEYLLETKIVQLVNRNTVGLTNAASFNSNVYIPSKIEELLEMRFNSLCENDGTKLYDFLKIAAYFGSIFSSEIFSCYFEEDDRESIDILLTHHFLKISQQGVMFDHESIFLFLKNKLSDTAEKEYIASLIYENKMLFNILEPIKKGEVLVFIDSIPEAKRLLNSPIEEIMGLNNVSSINLSSEFFELYYSIYFLASKERNFMLMQKTLLAIVYVSMHNLSSGQTIQAFNFVHNMLIKDFKNEDKLKITISVLQAHHYMSTGQMSIAKKMIIELLSTERVSPELYDDQTRFNLFDRAASLFLQENHIEPAKKYNKLSLEVAKKAKDYRLITLAQIINAKILFFSSTKKAYKIMLEAEQSINKSEAFRIRCHNDIGKLTAEILLNSNQKDSFQSLINKGNLLLEESVRVHYPLATIRVKYLLAVLYFLEDKIEMSKKYINSGIETSVRVGIIKLLPHYYNLKLIIAEGEEQDYETLLKYANTVLEYLRQQDQLFLGALDFGNSSILNITNYALFANKHLPENECYSFLKEIQFYGSDIVCDFKCDSHKSCSYSCIKSRELFLKSMKRIEKGNLLFLDQKHKYKLKDPKTNYYIPLGV